MKCSKCGWTNPNGIGAFCMQCGASLVDSSFGAASVPMCFTCGLQPPLGATRCTNCGGSIHGLTPPQPARNVNWAGVAIAGAVIVAGLLFWGFSAGVNKFWADQIPAENTETQSPVQPVEPEADSSAEEPIHQPVGDKDADIMLEELATYGSDSWTVDPYSDLSPYATSILLGGECAVWFFPDVETRNIVIDAGDFESLGYTYYYMAAGEAWDRVVLVAESEYSTCAVDASYMLGWDLSTFEYTD